MQGRDAETRASRAGGRDATWPKGESTSRRRCGPRVTCKIYRDVEAWGLASRDEAAHQAGTCP
jgi:hypothetical protein